MRIFRLSHCRGKRHVWHKKDVYFKALSASVCVNCGQPETNFDRAKLHIGKELANEFGESPTVAYWTITTRAAQLIKEYLASQREYSGIAITR